MPPDTDKESDMSDMIRVRPEPLPEYDELTKNNFIALNERAEEYGYKVEQDEGYWIILENGRYVRSYKRFKNAMREVYKLTKSKIYWENQAIDRLEEKPTHVLLREINDSAKDIEEKKAYINKRLELHATYSSDRPAIEGIWIRNINKELKELDNILSQLRTCADRIKDNQNMLHRNGYNEL